MANVSFLPYCFFGLSGGSYLAWGGTYCAFASHRQGIRHDGCVRISLVMFMFFFGFAHSWEIRD